jgi:hypothetical protein
LYLLYLAESAYGAFSRIEASALFGCRQKAWFLPAWCGWGGAFSRIEASALFGCRQKAWFLPAW